jgi:hypothetical protein
MGAMIQHDRVQIAGTDIHFEVGEMYVCEGKPAFALGIGINPIPPMHVTVVVEFGPKGAALGDEGNFKRIWMCSPIAVVSEVTIEENKVEVIKPRLVLPGEGAGA